MVVLFSFGMCLFSGCGTEKEGKRGKDLDYTVVPTEECPADFLAEINKKKINPFQMTYEDGEYCYLAVGYGEQETGERPGSKSEKEYAVSCRKNEKIGEKN